MISRGDRSTLPISSWAILPLIALLELAWLVWFESIRLPNAPEIGRFVFLLRALPEVVPGVTLRESFLGMGLSQLRHVENLAQRLPIVLVAALIAAGAFGLGGLILRALGLTRALSFTERLGAAFGVGASSLGAITLMAGRLGWLAPWPVRIGLVLAALAEGVCLVRERREWRTSPDPLFEGWLDESPDQAKARAYPSIAIALAWAGFLALTGPFLVLMALGSMLPSIEYDSIEYHLEGPKEWFLAGQIVFLPYNVYTSMPFNVEMLHLLGMETFNDWWWGALAGQLLVALHAPLAALMIALAARRIGTPRAAWFAAVVYLTTPWVFRLAALPYVEGPLCYYHAALLWAAWRAWVEPDPRLQTRLCALLGLLAGGAMACKYPALISAVIPFGLVSLIVGIRQRRLAPSLAFVVGWALIMTPWLARNVIDTGNPIYPLGYRVFGGRHWDPAMDRKWSNAHGPRPIEARLLWIAIVDVAGRSDWQSSLYVALAPLAFLRRDWRKPAIVLGGYVLYLFLTWWLLTHRLDRFWLPLLPPFAVLAGLGADWTRDKAWATVLGLVVILAFLANLAYSSTDLTSLNQWTGDLTQLRRTVPELLNPALAAIDTRLLPNAKILLVGEAAVFHVNHQVVYNTVFDDDTFETLARGHSPQEVGESLKRLGITHILVDWHDIERFRSPGNYGFTPFVTQAEFDRLVKARVLEPGVTLGSKRNLYRVIPPKRPED